MKFHEDGTPRPKEGFQGFQGFRDAPRILDLEFGVRPRVAIDNYADARRRLRDRDLGGLPPSLPFSRDEAAFRFDLTEPRHAGQKETRSIR